MANTCDPLFQHGGCNCLRSLASALTERGRGRTYHRLDSIFLNFDPQLVQSGRLCVCMCALQEGRALTVTHTHTHSAVTDGEWARKTDGAQSDLYQLGWRATLPGSAFAINQQRRLLASLSLSAVPSLLS